MNFTDFGDPIREWSRLTPGKVALVDLGRGVRVTYADLDAAAAQWAVLLDARGIRHGDRVAVLSGNRTEVIALFYGCARIGAAIVPLNWRLSVAELSRVLADAQVTLVVGETRFASVRESATGNVPWIDLDIEAGPLLRVIDVNHSDTWARTRLEDAAMILYTSGSTGEPKGAILSHRQILFNAIATTTAWQLGADDIAPISTPFFHTGGWHVFCTPIWLRGGTIVMCESFDPAKFIDVLDSEGCTVGFGVPTQLVMLIESKSWGRPLPKLKWFACGGAPCPPQIAARFRDGGYRLRLGFGMTEFGPNCFATSDDMAIAKPHSVGWPMPFTEMRIVDEQGVPVGDDVVGELMLRGPQLFSGYLHDSARTAEVLTADGWLKTGDLASRDVDGAYTIRGRRKDMFISGGENVFPGEVEAALVDCAGVAEAVVIGVSHERWGEVGHAFVQARVGASVNGDSLLSELRAKLAHYKVPKVIEVLVELPRIGSGKVDRAALKKMAVEISR
jgi:fatty-acyl-CoA synthase